MLGECGRRGGYMELLNFDSLVMEQLEKRISMNLCSNTSGQIMLGMSCNPPREGDESYEVYQEEVKQQYESLKRRANLLADAFNAPEGMSCNRPMGAMYLFPRIQLSNKALIAAAQAGHPPDTFYCLQLLEKTGIVSRQWHPPSFDPGHPPSFDPGHPPSFDPGHPPSFDPGPHLVQ